MSRAKSVPLGTLPTFAKEAEGVTIVVETPKGSRNKYGYDEEIDAFRLKFVLPEGSSFPYDFGFIPSTKGEDGDALDVLVLLDDPGPVGCVLSGRLIGGIKARQRPKGGEWVRNDRLIAIATHARTHEGIECLEDLRPRMVEEIEAFFIHYNDLNGRDFEPQGHCDAGEAVSLVEQGMAAYGAE